MSAWTAGWALACGPRPGSSVAEPLTPRARQIVAAARELLEQQGPAALTMRRLADRLGIRAPSLYKHLPDKAALEAAIIATGFEEAAATFEAALDGATEPLASLATAYRTFALGHPHLYRLMTDQPLPRDRLPSGLEDRTAAPLLRATGDPQLARAVFAFAHGMVLLELTGRLPAGADPQAAWHEGIAAFQARAKAHARQPLTTTQPP
jgi:AcrR family transcriptional regulator